MKGSEIIEKTGVTEIHCSLTKEIFEIDPEHDYFIQKGTDDNPKVYTDHAVKMIQAGKFPRLKLDGMEILNDEVEWTTGHNAFEGEVEPKFSPKRPKNYMTQ